MKNFTITLLSIITLLFATTAVIAVGSNDKAVLERFRNCQRYSEHSSKNYMGMDITYTMDIEGWQNNKCVVSMDAKVVSNNPEIGNRTLTPRIRCEFTKAQLDDLMTRVDQDNEQVMNLVSSQNTCTVANIEDLNSFAVQER